MDDIVTRLNEHPTVACGACDTWGKCGFGERCTCICHATERLHEKAAAEIERLRTAGDALADALRAETVNGSMAVCEGTNEALDTWQEARRD